jgi:hypothetical protein
MAVVDAVRQQSPLGGFVRCEAKSSNSWYEIGDEAAREKVGQSIRDALVDLDPSKKKERLLKRAANKAKRSRTRSLAKKTEDKKSPKKCSSSQAVTSRSSSLLELSQTAATFSSLFELRSPMQL